MTTLYASLIKLHALHAGELKRDSGEWANAVFYGIINAIDPVLAEALHQWNGRKPFTISGLGGLPRGGGKTVRLRAGWECWLRVTTLGGQLFTPFVQHFLQGGARPQIRLGGLSFGVSEVLTTPGSHPWAGYVEAETLLEQAEPAERLALEFVSPTRFNLGGRIALFPMPSLVFGSLASQWNAAISPQLDRQLVEEIAEGVMITGYKLHTRTQQWRRGVQKGFIGQCTYDLKQLPPEGRAIFCGLADFAFYSGVGGKTTQGMGQCRRLPR